MEKKDSTPPVSQIVIFTSPPGGAIDASGALEKSVAVPGTPGKVPVSDGLGGLAFIPAAAQTASFLLTAEQLMALDVSDPSTAIPLLPAPGEGLYYSIMFATVSTTAGPYLPNPSNSGVVYSTSVTNAGVNMENFDIVANMISTSPAVINVSTAIVNQGLSFVSTYGTPYSAGATPMKLTLVYAIQAV